MPPRVPFPVGRPTRDAIDDLPTPDLVESHSRQSTFRPSLDSAMPNASESQEQVASTTVRPMRTGGPMTAERRAQLRQERGFPSLPTQQSITIADGMGRAGPEYHFTRRTTTTDDDGDRARGDRPMSLDSSFNPPSLHALPSDTSIVPGQTIPGIIPSNSIQSVTSVISSRFRPHATPGPPINLAPARSPNQFITPPAQIGRQRQRRPQPQPATNSSIESYGTDVHSDLQPDGQDTPDWPTPSTDNPSSVAEQTPRSGAQPTPDAAQADYLTPASAAVRPSGGFQVFGSGSAWTDASPDSGIDHRPSPLARIEDTDAESGADDEAEAEVEEEEDDEAKSPAEMETLGSSVDNVPSNRHFKYRSDVDAPREVRTTEPTSPNTETASKRDSVDSWEAERQVVEKEMERLASSPSEYERKKIEFQEAMKARANFSKRQEQSEDMDSDNDSSDWEAKPPKQDKHNDLDRDSKKQVPTKTGPASDLHENTSPIESKAEGAQRSISTSRQGTTKEPDPTTIGKEPRRSLSVKLLNRKAKVKAQEKVVEGSPEGPGHELSLGEALLAGGPPSPIVPVKSSDKGKGRNPLPKSAHPAKDNELSESKRGSSIMGRLKSLDKSLRGKSTSESSSKKAAVGPNESFINVDISPTTATNVQTRSKDNPAKGPVGRWSSFLKPSTGKSGSTPPSTTTLPSITDSKLRYRVPGPNDALKPTKEVPDPFRRAMPGDDPLAEPTAIVVDEEPGPLPTHIMTQSRDRPKRESMLAPIKRSFSTIANPLNSGSRRPHVEKSKSVDIGLVSIPRLIEEPDEEVPETPQAEGPQSHDSNRRGSAGRRPPLNPGSGLLDAITEAAAPAVPLSEPPINFRDPFARSLTEALLNARPVSDSPVVFRDPFANFAWQSSPASSQRYGAQSDNRGRTPSGHSTAGSNVITAAQRIALEYSEERRRQSSPIASLNHSPAWSSRREREASRASSSLLPTESGLSDRLHLPQQRLAGPFALEPRQVNNSQSPEVSIPRATVLSPTPPPPGRSRTAGPVPPYRASNRNRSSIVEIGGLLPDLPARGGSVPSLDPLRLRPSTTSLRPRPRSDPLDFTGIDLHAPISPVSLSPSVEHFIENAPVPPSHPPLRRSTSADMTPQQLDSRVRDYPTITHTPAEVDLNSPEMGPVGHLSASNGSVALTSSLSTSTSTRQSRSVSFDETPEVTYYRAPKAMTPMSFGHRAGIASAAVQRIRKAHSSIDLGRPIPPPTVPIDAMLLPAYPTSIKTILPHLHFWTPILRREDERGVGRYRTRSSSKSGSKVKLEATHHWRPYAMVLSQVSKPLEISSPKSRFSLTASLRPRVLPALTTRSYIHLFSMIDRDESPMSSPEQSSSTGLSKFNPLPALMNSIYRPKTQESREALNVAKQAKKKALATDAKGSPRHMLDEYGIEEKERRAVGIYTWARPFDPLLDTIGTSAIDATGPSRPDGQILWHTDDHTKCMIELKFDDGVKGTEVWIIQIPQSVRHLRDEWTDQIAHQRREALHRGFPMPDSLSRGFDDHPVPGKRRERSATNAGTLYAQHRTDPNAYPTFSDNDDYPSDDDSQLFDDDNDAEDHNFMNPPPSAHRPAPTKGILKKIQSMSNVAAYREAGLSLHNDKPTWRDMEQVIKDQEPVAELLAVRERIKATRARIARGYETPSDEDSDAESDPVPRRRRKRELSGQTIRPTREDDEIESAVGDHTQSPLSASTSTMTRDHVVRYWKTIVAVEKDSARSAAKAAAANKAALSKSAKLNRTIRPEETTNTSAGGAELDVPDLDKSLSRESISTDLETNDSQQSSASNASTVPSIASVVQRWRPTWEQEATRRVSKKSSILSIHRRSAAIDVGTAVATERAPSPDSPGTARSGGDKLDAHFGSADPTFELASGFLDSQTGDLHESFHKLELNDEDLRDFDSQDDTTPELSPLTDNDLPLPPIRFNAHTLLTAHNSNVDDTDTSAPVPNHDDFAEDVSAKEGSRKRMSKELSSGMLLRSGAVKEDRKPAQQASDEDDGTRGRAPTRATSATPFADPNPLALAPAIDLKATDTRNPNTLGSIRHYRSVDFHQPKLLEDHAKGLQDRRTAPGARVERAMQALDARLKAAVGEERLTWGAVSKWIERDARQRTKNDLIPALYETWGIGASPDEIPRGRGIRRYPGF